MGLCRGTIIVGDRLIRAHWRTFNDVCRRIVVAEDCVVPPRHEANIPVRMSSDRTPHPPYSDWAIEPHIPELGAMAAQTLLSDGHGVPVAHVCNYSGKPYTFKADSFLGLSCMSQQ